MKKLTICKSATLFFGILAVGILTRLDSVTGHLRHGDLIGAGLGLLSAIFGSQWVEYQRRSRFKNLSLLLIGSLLNLSVEAQNNLIIRTPISANPGNQNVMIGSAAGNNTMTGYYNTFIGNEAGYLSTTGRGNTFVGFVAGVHNTTGDWNSFIGSAAGESNTTGAQNTFIGNAAGYENTTGFSNVFTGMQAGNANTVGSRNIFTGTFAGTKNTTGSDNVFTGDQSGYNNLLGFKNVFSGSGTGFSNTTGNNSVFSGYQAGYNNTTGGSNVFMGIQAGFSNTTSNDNAFMGAYSGYSNTAGTNNAFLGTYSGYSNSTGIDNAFVGAYSGYYTTTGHDNAFVGTVSGISNTTGSYNSFMGTNAGYFNLTGYSNVAMGIRAAFSNQTGHHNVMLGDSAGLKTTASRNLSVGSKAGYSNTTGSDNTFVGTQADAMPGKTNLTNAAAIGANARVGISNAIVLGDTILNTRVGIGITAPAFPLDVRGTVNIRNGGLNFASRVKLQVDDADYLVLTAADSGQSGLRFAHLTSKIFPTKTTGQVLSVDEQGRVGLYQIGLPASQIRLEVSSAAQWADFVLAPEYQLASLDDIESYISTNRHLPGIPSTEVVKRDGIDLGTLNTLLLQKVEELTLYLIEQSKQITALQQQVLRLSGAR